MKKYLSLLLWIVGFESVSAVIGMTTQNDVSTWYKALEHPPLTPPDIVFPVVWISLYAMVAVAGWRIWQMPAGADKRLLQRMFMVYMAMNWLWSFIFFSAHMMLAGFVWILLMNLLTIWIIAKAWKTARPAALLLVPLLLWTSFAAYLNGGVWYLN